MFENNTEGGSGESDKSKNDSGPLEGHGDRSEHPASTERGDRSEGRQESEGLDASSADRSVRATGDFTGKNQEERACSKTDERSLGDLLNEAQPNRSELPTDKQDAKDLLKDLDKMQTTATERSEPWKSCDAIPSGALEAIVKPLRDVAPNFAGAVDDFVRNYCEMKAVKVKGADDYFHCMANCEASSRGPTGEAVAKAMSVGREAADMIKNPLIKGMSLRDSFADCAKDLASDRVGWRGGASGERCTDVCGRFKVNGL
jgi:hypothetical protein